MHILWLASWYPDLYEGKNGDFVQRHAKAFARLNPVQVIHITQAGCHINTFYDIHSSEESGIRELSGSFDYKPWGIVWMDKLRYNLKYQLFYMQIIKKYVQQYGIPDLVHVHAPMKAGIIAYQICNRWKIPLLITDHSSLYDLNAKDRFNKRSWYFKKQLKKLYKNAAGYTNVSDAMAKRVKSLFNTGPIEIIRNVVQTDLFSYQPQTQNSIFRWIHVSTLYPLKNVQKILEAFQILYSIRQDWELVIVGGNYQKLELAIRNTGIQHHVIFTGELEYTAVAKKLQASSAMVMFSKHENFPCTVIEALCCGVPVVASDVGGVSEAVNASNGILVESENIAALVAALEKMMIQYAEFNRRFIAETAASTYGESIIGGQFLNLYNRVLKTCHHKA
jgi:glycosyltransferase involved in cell wall biosynthesis